MHHPSELSDGITQIINALSPIQTASQENQYSLQTYAMQLEVLAETSLASVDIPLEVVDVLNSARKYEIYSNSNQWLQIYMILKHIL